MTAFKGRKVTLTWDGEAIAGCREKAIALNGEPVDVSDDSSAGWRTLLAEPGEKAVDLSLSGVTKSAVLRTAWFAGETQETVVVTYPTGGGSFTGTFHLASYQETGAYNDAVTFDCELQSTGAVVFTPPA